MTRKLGAAAGVLAAIALMLPAVANAALVTQGGVALPLGANIEAESVNASIATEVRGTINCATLEFEGELTENGANVVVEEAAGKEFGCFVNAKPIELEEIEFSGLTLVNPFVGSVGIEFEAELPGAVVCVFTGIDAVKYLKKGAEINVQGELEGGACGETAFFANFTLSSGGAVVLD